MTHVVLEFSVAFFLLFGAAFVLLGALGLVKFPDTFTRLHAPTKASTLGVGSILVASAMVFSTSRGALSLHELLVTIFLFMTAPISAYLLAKTALHECNDDGWPHRTQADAALATSRDEQGLPLRAHERESLSPPR